MSARTVVACFGEALIDFLARPGDVPGESRHFIEQAGGAPANVAVGVARLGGHARFIGMLGKDMFGDFLRAELGRHGVDTSQVRHTGVARTALAFVSLGDAGERSFAFYRPPSADLLFRADDFDDAAFDDIAVLHACSNSMTEPAACEATLAGMRMATEAGALVSFDMNLRPALWAEGADQRAVIWQALELAHLVKLSREELEFLNDGDKDDTAIARLFSAATQALVVTNGAQPIRWWTRDTRGNAATFGVDPVDTTAAGDAFVAGLLHALVEHEVAPASLGDAFIEESIRSDLLQRAMACGALATTRYGAFAAMPSRQEADALVAIHAGGTR